MYKKKVFSIIRTLTKNSVYEKLVVKFIHSKFIHNFFVKFLPRNFQYNFGEKRDVIREGIRYELDISNYNDYIVYFGIDDQFKNELYNLIKKNMFVVDIGTNIGEVILSIAKINTTGQILGFEPIPYNYNKAIKNVSLNNFTNIKIENIALSDIQETLYFEEPKIYRHSGGMNLNKEKSISQKSVMALPFDLYKASNNLPKIDLIKIDVEGFETNVIQGALNTLQTDTPILFIEVNERHLKSKGSSAKELIKIIEKISKYKIIRADTKSVINSDESFNNCHYDIICLPN